MKAEIVGKPSAKFFLAAIEDMQISPEDVSFILIFNAQAGFNILHSFQFKRSSRGDWLRKRANIKVENSGAVVYVGSSRTVHNPLFFFHKL